MFVFNVCERSHMGLKKAGGICFIFSFFSGFFSYVVSKFGIAVTTCVYMCKFTSNVLHTNIKS